MQYLSLVLCLHLQSLTDCKVPLSQGPGYIWRWLVVTMTTGRGLIYSEIRDWAGSKADSALKWNRVLVSASKVRWPELSQLSLCSEFDKENSMEFSLNSLLLIHFTTMTMHLLSHSPHVTLVMWQTVTVTICDHLSHHCDIVTLSHAPSCSCKSNKKRKEKKRKRNINNDLAVLPSHDNVYLENL